MKDFGSIKNSFCLTKGDNSKLRKGEVPGEEAPISGLPSIPYPAHSPSPANRRTPELCK